MDGVGGVNYGRGRGGSVLAESDNGPILLPSRRADTAQKTRTPILGSSRCKWMVWEV